jgi:hypothetical protein
MQPRWGCVLICNNNNKTRAITEYTEYDHVRDSAMAHNHKLEQHGRSAALAQELGWLQSHEAACSAVTELMRARLSHQLVALQCPGGNHSCNPKEQAKLHTTQFAVVSAAPVITPQAQTAVLTATIMDSTAVMRVPLA